MSTAFGERVSFAAREILGPTYKHQDSSAWVNDPQREQEANAVDACVTRLIDYELHPSGKGVGRYAPVSIIAPIGEVLGTKHVSSLEGDSLADLIQAVRLVIACGYVASSGLEMDGEGYSPQVDAAPAVIWNFWVVRLDRRTLDAAHFPRPFQDQVRGYASHRFGEDVDALGLMQRRRRRKIEMLGMWYAQAGMTLRLVQSLCDRMDLAADHLQSMNRWPFERD